MINYLKNQHDCEVSRVRACITPLGPVKERLHLIYCFDSTTFDLYATFLQMYTSMIIYILFKTAVVTVSRGNVTGVSSSFFKDNKSKQYELSPLNCAYQNNTHKRLKVVEKRRDFFNHLNNYNFKRHPVHVLSQCRTNVMLHRHLKII